MDVSKYDFVIVDEDIIFSTVIPNKTEISISKLKKLLKKIPTSDPLAGKIRKVLKGTKSKEFFKLHKIPCDKEAYDDGNSALRLMTMKCSERFSFI